MVAYAGNDESKPRKLVEDGKSHMLTAISSTNEKVIAAYVEKDQGPFICAHCKSPLLLKKGKIRVHHFSHFPPVNCTYGGGESQAHLSCKLEIYEELSNRENVDKLELERVPDGVRPDISFRVNKRRYVGIEIQISNLTIEEIERRTKRYAELRIGVCWILPMNNDIREDRMAPKAWERWCHLLYFGRVYYWTGGIRVLPVHFGDHLLDIPYASWYGAGGEERSAGGFQRVSKRYKEALIHDSLDLVDDFVLKKRPSYETTSYEIPEAVIWADSLNRWW